MQLTLQRRITTITKNWLSERIRRRKRNLVGREETAENSLRGDDHDTEKGLQLEDTGPKGNTTDGFTWVLLFLLFLGDIASVVGYIGCFSVVQSATSSRGPVSWLCSEIGLSLIRIVLWSINPKMDDAPPLEFVLNLKAEAPLPTCNRSNDMIWYDKVLPLTRASPFLNLITSSGGLVKHFARPGLTLYYTLTRAGPNPEENINENEQRRSADERVLYITIFDHKERTTRVFTREGVINHFYAADVPDVNLEHGLLEAKLGEKINSKNDPIVGDDEIQTSLVEHYQSLIRSTASRLGCNQEYRIGNVWTMKVAGIILASEERINLDDEDDDAVRDRRYLEQGRFEKTRGSLDVKRGEWIETYMRQVISETRERYQAEKASIRNVDELLALGDEATGKRKGKEAGGAQITETESNPTTIDEAMELSLIQERRFIEKLFVYEVEEWEEQLWKSTEEFIRSDEVQEKESVEWEWKANCWKRLDANVRAMNERMEAAKANGKGTSDHFSWLWRNAHDDIQTAWQSAMKRFVHGSPPPSITSCRGRLEEDFNKSIFKTPLLSGTEQAQPTEEIESRLGKELDDIEFRLGQGLEKCDQFFGGDELVKARHSRAKWLSIPMSSNKAELESRSRALKTCNDVVYIDFVGCDVDWVIETIGGLPSLTSVRVDKDTSLRLRDIQRDSPLFVDSSYRRLSKFLDDNQLPSDHTFIFIGNGGYPPRFSSTEIGLNKPTLAISFIGPTSGSLTLRLRHHSFRSNCATLRLTVTQTGSSTTSTSELPVSSLLTTNDVSLRPHPSERLSFMPGSRNNLIIKAELLFFQKYWLQDIQLLDEAGYPYNPRPSDATDLSQVPSISKLPMPASQPFHETGTSSHSPVSLPAQHAESGIDDISEGTDETDSVEAIQSVAEAGKLIVNSGIEEERR